MSLVRLVCFDLGGVLVRICRNWEEATAQAKLPLRRPERLLGAEWQSRRRAVVWEYQLGNTSSEEYLEQMSVAVDRLYSIEEVKRIHDCWTMAEYHGVESLVDELNELGTVQTACLSNTNHAHWVRLVGLTGTREYPSVAKLQYRLASHELRLAKPDLQIYVEAQRHFGCSASEILFFDDLAENIDAARVAGWRAEQVDYSVPTEPQLRAHLAAHSVF